MSITEPGHRSCDFEHEAFVYDSDREYVLVLVPLIEQAHRHGDSVVAVVSRSNTKLLRSVLGEADATEFIEAEAFYEHPVNTIARYDGMFRQIPAPRRALVIGEVQFGAAPAGWTSWTRYESVLNQALHGHNARVICPYDTRVLPATVLDDARRTHPRLLTMAALGGEHDLVDATLSVDYLDPATLVSRLPPTATIPTSRPSLDLAVDGDLQSVRRSFVTVAAATGLGAERIQELLLAVNEILSNALLHGGGAARLRIWSSPNELVCMVEDDGAGARHSDSDDHSLLGFTRPAPGTVGGYGTWLARRLFEHSEFRRSPTGGLSVLLTTRS